MPSDVESRSDGTGLRHVAPFLLLTTAAALKLWLLVRVNINWDEFHYLEYVHAFHRGEAVPALQTLHVHLFGWLTRLQLDEVGQVLAARFVMATGLLATLALLWRLARLWVDGWLAWLAPLSYLLASPVFKHGASFRSDSLLAPLLTSVALLLAQPSSAGRVLVVAGILFGLAGAISIKAILALPMVLGLLAFGSTSRSGFPRRTAIVGGTALLTFLFCVWLHGMAIPTSGTSAPDLVMSAARKTLLAQDFVPARRHLEASWLWDRTIWLMLGFGLGAAVLRRQYALAVLSLSLLPVVFYRNAFPYYYAVMLTPAAVLVAFGAQEASRWLTRGPKWLAMLCGSLVLLLFAAKLAVLHGRLVEDRVSRQAALIAAVHRIFPEPVPYIDHSGMVASFPKANSFMSTWRLSVYREAGVPFMPAALGRRPPLLLANSPVLDPESGGYGKLLEPDRDAIAGGYVRYWGPVFVAGVERQLEGGAGDLIRLPYPGHYRLVTDGKVLVNGQRFRSGDVIELASGEAHLAPAAPAGQTPVRVALFDARANPPPVTWAAPGVIYDAL